MTTERVVRINEMLRREVAEALFRLINENGFDVAAVTVTRAFASRDLQHARVLVSIRGDAGEQRRMLALICRHRGDIQDQINRNLRLRYTPRLLFELDPSLAKGAHMLDVLAHMEQETGGTQGEEGAARDGADAG